MGAFTNSHLVLNLNLNFYLIGHMQSGLEFENGRLPVALLWLTSWRHWKKTQFVC